MFRSRLYTTSAGVTGWPSQNLTPGRSVNTIVVGEGFATVARPGSTEPSGAWRSSDSHISETAVESGKPSVKMGSSDITSRLVAQTTEDTGLVPAGVMAVRPLVGETSPGDEFADRPQAAASAHTAAAMIIHRRGHLFTCVSPSHFGLRISITNWPAPCGPFSHRCGDLSSPVARSHPRPRPPLFAAFRPFAWKLIRCSVAVLDLIWGFDEHGSRPV